MDKTLKEAVALRTLGFAIHWVHQNSKAPVESKWSEAPVKTIDELVATYRPGYNVGFRPGKWSVVNGKEVCVLDVDIRSARYAPEAYLAADGIADGLRFDVISGSRIGRHYYLAVPIGESPDKSATTLRQSDIWIHQVTGRIVTPRTKGSKPAWMVELLSTGKQVLMPPSIHTDTLQPYEWNV
jgi:hypothetical protein